MLKVLSEKIREHILSNLVSYIVLTLLFVAGIIGGAYIYNCYSKEEVGILYEFFSDAREIYIKSSGNNLEVFKSSLASSFQTVILIWLLGFTVIGIPVILFSVVKKGFILGLISSFLISNFSNGVLCAIILFFIQSAVLIPAIFFVANYSISLSKTLIGMVFGKIRFKVNFKYYLLFYLVIFFGAIVCCVIYALLEGYFTSNILKWFFINSLSGTTN